ncbi:tyrosine-protein kinase-like otk [Leptidea sinapis]|uniref:tyrosine-protein kinase-like otk n=1 Tax=Leptidea sinapis TaxID=189913 RepID=UPI00212F96A1|nr:tyrosine-protein kinase-like otk [Leptidea sinapis]
MCLCRVLFVFLILYDIFGWSAATETWRPMHLYVDGNARKHRAVGDGGLRFEPAPYNKKLELNGVGKIHCKVAGGVAPAVQWFMNDADALPEGVSTANGTLLIAEAKRDHAGQYTCRATEGETTISAKITLDVVVSPRVLEPTAGQQVHVRVGEDVTLNCRAIGDPSPTIHWDRNSTILSTQNDDVQLEGGANETTARIMVWNNGTLQIRNVTEDDAYHYGCTAGSIAGLSRAELELVVHNGNYFPPQESGGVAGKAVLVSISVAGAYMLLVLALMVYCRRRRLQRRQRGEKLELEMVEGREKLVEEGEKKIQNGGPHNGRLLPNERDSGADNSEVSLMSRASKKSGQYEHLSVPKSLITEQITLGRGEFGEVMLAKIDLLQVKKLRNKDEGETEPQILPILVKALTTKDECQLSEFRRQLDLFSRVRHDNMSRLIGLCNESEPHYMLLEHTDWGDLKTFLIATRTVEENEEYTARVGQSHALPQSQNTIPPLGNLHRVVLAQQLAGALNKIAAKRLTHRDVSARNCLITSQLQLKLSFPALTRGPNSHEYHKLHDQVIPLRWLPQETVMEGDYSTKSDVYMFAATIWEIYTKAELPFAKLNDNSVLERIKSGTLDWTVPGSMPDKLAGLLKRCWNKSPTDRPHFIDLFNEITSIIDEMKMDSISQHSNDIEEDK